MVYYPLYGGGTVRFKRYFPGLKRRGIRMGVFTQAPTQKMIAKMGFLGNAGAVDIASQSRSVAEVPEVEVIDGVSVWRTKIPGGLLRGPMFFRRLAAYCEERSGQIDVVQLPSAGAEAAPWIRRLRRLGIGTVMAHTLHGEFSSNPYRRTLQRLYRRVAFNLVDRIVVNSSVMKRDLEALGVSTPIQAIPNGVDLERFRPINGDDTKWKLRLALGMRPEWEVIVTVGAVTHRKGTDVLINAFMRLCLDRPAARLVLVGPGPDSRGKSQSGFDARVLNEIEKAGIGDRITFTGEVNNVADYLRAADVLVFPSRREGMPNVPLEAMACATPVIMTPFIGLPEEFGVPGTQYLLSDWDPETLASNIAALLSDPQRRVQMGIKARRWVEQSLDVNASLDQYATMYRELAEGSGTKYLQASRPVVS